MAIMERLETVERDSKEKINTLNDRIAAFLNAAGNRELELSEGSIYGFCKKFAQASQADIQRLENKLLNQEVVATDATVVTVNGEQDYIRNFSIKDTVVCHAMDSKSIEALKGLDCVRIQRKPGTSGRLI